MAKTYIFGHKNPDTDSVCSSIALSYLKNELGDATVPKVLGDVNEETKYALNYFDVSIPSYLNDVRIRIKDVKYDKKAFIHELASIDKAFKVMQKHNITAIPLIDDNKLLIGYVTLKEIARYLINGNKERIDTTFENIVDALEAEIINQADEFITGNISVVGMQAKTFQTTVSLSDEDILIVGDRHKILEYAIDSKVKLIILTMNSSLDKKQLAKAKKNNVNIIGTNMDTYQVASKILLSNYIKTINLNHSPVTVNVDDYYTDFKEMMHQINHTNYPVINNKGECLGLIRLTGPNTFEKKKVILVDHNAVTQTVDGIEEAEILEIVDHHNLGAIGTSSPIQFRSKPVGCTATIIYDLYKEKNVKIPKHIAGLMLSSILSDTMIFSSPTATDDDRFVAKQLSSIAGVDIEKYGMAMLKAGASVKGLSIDEIIHLDLKSYNYNNRTFGVGQVFTLDIDYIENNKDEFVERINEITRKEDNILNLILVTDIIKKGSYLFFNTDSSEIIKEVFGLSTIEEGTYVPNIVSRKKQVIPRVMDVLDQTRL